jgi:hypothetical protein
MSKTDYVAELENCKDFADVFKLVKKSVKKVFGRSRVGLMLYLSDLPPQVGAYHVVGSNGIVLNRAVLDTLTAAGKSKKEVNCYLYSILLHEYLHSLGHTEEQEVRRLVYKVTKETFGEEHLATQMALRGPLRLLPEIMNTPRIPIERTVEIIRDFESLDQPYIS